MTGFDDGLCERSGVRAREFASEVPILFAHMVGGATDQAGGEGRGASFNGVLLAELSSPQNLFVNVRTPGTSECNPV